MIALSPRFRWQTIVDGMTKNVQFDVNGRRTEINVQISSLTSEGSIKIATWDADYGIKATPIAGAISTVTENFLNRTFIVLISMVRKMFNFQANMNFEWKFSYF